MRSLSQSTVVTKQDRKLLHEVKMLIRESLPTANILLFGSVARGTQDAESDYDLLVLTDAPLSHSEQNEIRSAVFDWEIERDVVISMLFRSKEEWDSPLARISPFCQRVEQDALAL